MRGPEGGNEGSRKRKEETKKGRGGQEGIEGGKTPLRGLSQIRRRAGPLKFIRTVDVSN